MKWAVVPDYRHVDMPEWMHVVRMRPSRPSSRASKQAAMYALWDTRRRGRAPFVPLPAGVNRIRFGRADVVVDVGSYIGAFAVRAARAGAGRVTAFDPSPIASFVLAKNAVSFGFSAVQAAVMGGKDVPPTIDLMVGLDTLGLSNSCFNSPRNPKTISVPVVSYEEACRGATIVKMDAEGAEYDYPIGEVEGEDLRAMMISFHKRADLDWRVRAADIVARLGRQGFQLVNKLDLTSFSGSYNLEGVWIRG